MCYLFPGPRCSNGAVKAVAKAQDEYNEAYNKYHEAGKENRKNPEYLKNPDFKPSPEVVAAKANLDAAAAEWQDAKQKIKETPSYIKKSLERAKKEDEAGNPKLAGEYRAAAQEGQRVRSVKIAAYKQSVKDKENHNDTVYSATEHDVWAEIESEGTQRIKDVNTISDAWEKNAGPVTYRMPLVQYHGHEYAGNIVGAFREQKDADIPNPQAVEHYAAELAGVLTAGGGRDNDKAGFKQASEIASRHSGMKVKVSKSLRGFGAITAKATPTQPVMASDLAAEVSAEGIKADQACAPNPGLKLRYEEPGLSPVLESSTAFAQQGASAYEP